MTAAEHRTRMIGLGAATAVIQGDIDPRGMDEGLRRAALDALGWALEQAAAAHILHVDDELPDPLDYRGEVAA